MLCIGTIEDVPQRKVWCEVLKRRDGTKNEGHMGKEDANVIAGSKLSMKSIMWRLMKLEGKWYPNATRGLHELHATRDLICNFQMCTQAIGVISGSLCE